MIRSLKLLKGTLEELRYVPHPMMWNLSRVKSHTFEFAVSVALDADLSLQGTFEIDPKEVLDKDAGDACAYVALALFQTLWDSKGFIREAQSSFCNPKWDVTLWTIPGVIYKRITSQWTWGKFYRAMLKHHKISIKDCGNFNVHDQEPFYA